jgi:hypothetical protein
LNIFYSSDYSACFNAALFRNILSITRTPDGDLTSFIPFWLLKDFLEKTDITLWKNLGVKFTSGAAFGSRKKRSIKQILKEINKEIHYLIFK